jgi:hypothetical protein
LSQCDSLKKRQIAFILSSPTERAGRIAARRDFPEVHRKRVECQKRVRQQLSNTEQAFARCDGLDGADDAVLRF